MFATDIPGYVQGFRFSDDSAYYDSDALRFRDQAGYDHRGNGLQITIGTPAFVTDAASGERGLTLDNTVQGRFLNPIPWEGAIIAVMKPAMSANGTIFPVIFGVASLVTSNAYLAILRATATDYRHRAVTGSAVLECQNRYTTGDMAGLKVGAFSTSQETRMGYATADGVSVTTDGPAAFSVQGGSTGMTGGADDTREDGQWARFGNLSGVLDDTSATTNTMTIFEMHFFKGNPLVASLSEVKAFMDTLKARYGVA